MSTYIWRAFLAASLVSLTLASTSQAKPAPRSADARRIADAMLHDLHAVSGVPGLGAAVWKNGRIVWTGSAGMRDREAKLPVEADTRFRLASVSKLFAATAAARLAEEGKLDLDAPVTTVLPWLKNDWAPFTARQLASHTSGLPHYGPQDLGLGAIRYASDRHAVAIFSGRPLLFAPGTRYSYSSWGFTLLGALIEEKSGQPFGDYVQRVVASGLDVGLDATGTAGSKASVAYEFTGKVPKPAPARDMSYTWAGGGLMASARDVARFGGAMLEDRIVSRATFERMLAQATLSSGQPAGEDGYTVGFGWRSGVDTDGRATAFHNGSTLGARSSLVLWREEGVAASILSNASWTSAIDRTAEMLAVPFRAVSRGGAASSCPTGATRYEGQFDNVRIAGPARFVRHAGVCRGEMRIPKVMSDHFANGPQPGGDRVRIVAVTADGRLGRAGLVTPFGIYDLRLQADGSYVSALGSRKLAFRVSR